MDIGIKGYADRFDDLRASPLVHLLKGQADGAEPGCVTGQLLLGQRARYIDWPNIDLDPAALLEDLQLSILPPPENTQCSSK